MRPLEIAGSKAWWNANITGKDEDFKRKEEAQNRIDEALANRDAFEEVKDLKEHRKEIDDPTLARCIDVLYLAYLEKQVDPDLLKKMVAKANAVEKAFNVFRAKVDGKEMTDSEVREMLKILERLRAAQGGLGGEQGRRRRSRGRPQGAGQAAQRGGREARLQELSRAAALPQRAGRRRSCSSCSTSSTS